MPLLPRQQRNRCLGEALAFATHGCALAPVLAAREDTGTRLALALAYDRLLTGESDHAAWLVALGRARR